ncbi:hypothetical protein G6F57_013933 [Rhizopus arrhizus]|nr:hypothetical protein G6F57_013933 [Rhizopus arrhizus]
MPSNDRTLLGFLKNAKEEQNSTYGERSIANKAADGVIQYKKFEDLDIQIGSFEQYYKNILGIYIDIFDKEKYEKISDYDHAKNNSYKLLCLSSQLLKEAAQYNIKTWSTLPRPSHGIVFAPLSGSDCIFEMNRQDELWETLFNIKHEQSKRRKPNEEYSNAKIDLDYGWKTDEYMVAV